MKQFLQLCCIGAVLAAASAPPATAQVILFNNFAPGNGYITNIGWTQTGPLAFPGTDPWTQAESFIPGATTPLLRIEVAINHVGDPRVGANYLRLELRDDSGGQPGTNVLESWTFVDAMGRFGDLNPPLLAASILNPLLAAGSRYWIVPFVADDTWAAWNRNSIGDIGSHAQSRDLGATWAVSDQVRGAFRVTGVPEPSAMLWLAAAGTAGSLLRLRRRAR